MLGLSPASCILCNNMFEEIEALRAKLKKKEGDKTEDDAELKESQLTGNMKYSISD